MTPEQIAALRAAAESMPPGHDYVLGKDEVLDLLDHIAKIEAENVSLRGNCARMSADAKHQTRALKRSLRECDALRAEAFGLRNDLLTIARAIPNLDWDAPVPAQAVNALAMLATLNNAAEGSNS